VRSPLKAATSRKKSGQAETAASNLKKNFNMHLPNNTLLQGGKYRIIRFISSGGFGCTYEAEHTMLEKRVAIKEFFVKTFCNRDENTAHVTVGTQSQKPLVSKLRKKFIEEAKAVSQLQHPNIVNVSDVFEENGTAYFVMDYIDGRSLSDIVNHDGPLPEAKALKYIRQVALALQYVHEQNRLHLDIKPGNIMVNAVDQAILIDFGASKQYDEESGENTSSLLGKTPGYAPIEQMGNDVRKFTPATDIYALGATLYKLLSGVAPLSSTDLAGGEELSPLPARVSASTVHAIAAAMTMNKSKRPQSVKEFLALLDAVAPAGEETIFSDCTTYKTQSSPEPHPIPQKTPQPITSPSAPKKKTRKKVLVWMVAVLVVVGIAIGVVYNYTPPPLLNASQPQEISGETFTVNGISFKMMKVEGGVFRMGGTSEQNPTSLENPVHRVTLSTYYIGETEVTQALWKAVMGLNPSYFTGNNRPVEKVSWDDCQTFIRKLNSLTGENFRLPTEAEWEFAARGGNNSRGYQYSGSNTLGNVAWYGDNSGDQTHNVKTLKSNELGIYDMSGNVWEWCQDWYDSYSLKSDTNTTGAASGAGRVRRGGSWGSNARNCYSADRSNLAPGSRYNYLGLRLAL
jgi:formylglycine-generating enzyme required for sulfatase activity